MDAWTVKKLNAVAAVLTVKNPGGRGNPLIGQGIDHLPFLTGSCYFTDKKLRSRNPFFKIF